MNLAVPATAKTALVRLVRSPGLSSARTVETEARVGLTEAWQKPDRSLRRDRERRWWVYFCVGAVQHWALTPSLSPSVRQSSGWAGWWLRARLGGPRPWRWPAVTALSVIASLLWGERRATGISSALLGPLELSRLQQPTSGPSQW